MRARCDRAVRRSEGEREGMCGLEDGCDPRPRGLRWADSSHLCTAPEAPVGDRSLNDEIGLQRSGGFDSLEDSNDSGRLDADAIEAADQGSEARSAEDGDGS